MNKTKNKKIKKKKEKARHIERPAEVAFYFGFTEISSPSIEKKDKDSIKWGKRGELNSEKKEDIYKAEEKARILRLYFEDMKAFPQHYFLFYRKPLSGGSLKKRTSNYECGLDIIGSSKAVAEALVIQAALSILSEEGFVDLEIIINSIGDKGSFTAFERELIAYYRQNIEKFPTLCRQTFKKDIFEILRTEDEKCREAVADAPQSLNLLSDSARLHFKEVLEFLESMGVPYTIDNHLIGNPFVTSHTIFEIQGTTKSGKKMLLASGYRYNDFSKKVGIKKEMPAVRISLSWKRRGKPAPRRLPKPIFYLVQLGTFAKFRSLPIIESLRKAKVPIFHALTKDKYGGQSGTAENMRVPFLLIFGQKEAIENTIAVRDVKTRFQETTSLAKLPSYLKKLSS